MTDLNKVRFKEGLCCDRKGEKKKGSERNVTYRIMSCPNL